MAKHAIKKAGKLRKPTVFENIGEDSFKEGLSVENPDISQGREENGNRDLEINSDLGSNSSGGSEGGSGDGQGGRSSGGKGCKNGRNLFLTPIIVLVIITLLAWSWLTLLSPDFSKKAEPYISKYFERIVSVLSFQSPGNQGLDSSSSIEPIDKNSVTTDKNTQSSNESPSSSTTGTDNSGSTETTKDNKKPSLDLQIYEGPTYSAEEETCSYSVKAIVTGDPTPVVQFSRDDSKGTLGPKTTLISLKRNATSYTLTATARNEYGTAMDSVTINWGCNMPPKVSEISLSSDIVYVNKEYNLSVTATDPDKDSITYKWTVTGGTLSADNVSAVKWTTPSAPEDYQVKVDIKDSKGALTSKTISVYVGSQKAPETTAPSTTAPSTTAPSTTAPSTTAPSTTTPGQTTLDLPKKSSEGGYLEYGGETFAGGNVYAGDSSSDKPCVGFISFDITSLAGKTISTAKLTFSSVSVQGDPLSYCDSFWINAADWGTDPILQDDFNITGAAIQSFTNSSVTCTADKLKSEIQKAIDSGKTRFQVRVHFSGPYSNNDSSEDGWEYTQQNINLNVTF